MIKIFYIGLLLVVLLSGCSLFQVNDPESSENVFAKRRVRAYFTDPGTSAETFIDTGIPKRIASLLNSSRRTIDICIYELSNPDIFQAVINAHRRGVLVRFVGDIDNIGYSGYQSILAEKIPMRLGNDTKIMHNKYILIDERYLITGSMNFTTSGANHNNENVLFIDSPELCDYYKKDFETMFEKGLFGLNKLGNGFTGIESNRFFLTNGDSTVTKIDVYFTPYFGYDSPNRVDLNFMKYIDNAQSSIYFAIFAFTHKDIAQAVVNASKFRHVKVFGVFDKSWHSANEYSFHQFFLNELGQNSNVFVKYDGNENFIIGNPLHGSKCHNKYMVIDAWQENAVVLTGSYNFSSAASYKGNDENWLAIYDQLIAQDYASNFSMLYSLGNGRVASDWLNTTASINIYPAFAHIKATPGAD